ncbi:ABC transporter ATP-binding protein [Haloglycomyces albus]|uniref:ABC transporter ATP-binding protein n=1 Tax=Haloglycomyces albus TaxID=526067 RepID=UPI00046CCEE8|nr:ABC transporter ATP-binding protein [Haloglycomyces albus]
MPNTGELRGVNLRKEYGSTVALGGVTMEIPAGQSTAIIGPSGSGKSTLLHALAAILQPDSGEVHLNGERIDRYSEGKRSALRRTRFGFLFQFNGLLPELTARDNVALPLMLNGTARRRAYTSADAWLHRLGIHGLTDNRPGEMSGGQAQRVALARALVIEPSVVFADEPTGALDQATGTETLRTLLDTVKDRGASLVMVTHDLNVAGACERVVEIRDGHIISDSRPSATIIEEATV